MTAPVTRFSKEQMLARAAALECGGGFDSVAAMLRQAAAEGQGNGWEARWKALAVEAAQAAVCTEQCLSWWGNKTLSDMSAIEGGIPATPTEPTPPPAGNEWRDIETAPDALNVGVIVCDGPAVGEAQRREDGWYWANLDSSDHHASPIYPTHWQPLPAAPSHLHEAAK